MGSLVGGIVAQAGIPTWFLSRTREGALAGLDRAIAQARSEVIARRVVCGDYEHCLDQALAEADWIVECVSEVPEIKQGVYNEVERHRRSGSVVSSMTSSLPLESFCEGRSEDFRRHFLGIHFYNPPSRLIACEVAPQPETDPSVVGAVASLLEGRLGREVIRVRASSGYAGNRIAFLLFCEATALVEQSGVEMVDYLLGPYIGRSLSPLATLDLVGLDVHVAITRSVQEHTRDWMHRAWEVPAYLETMVRERHLGRKTPERGGFYRREHDGRRLVFDPARREYRESKACRLEAVERAKELVHVGRYREALQTVLTDSSEAAGIVRRQVTLYLAYAYAQVGEVTDVVEGIRGIDRVMAYGYGWAPPSVLLNLAGGPQPVIEAIRAYGWPIPAALEQAEAGSTPMTECGRFFCAR